MIVQRRPPRPNSGGETARQAVAVVVPTTSVPEEALLAGADYDFDEITCRCSWRQSGGATCGIFRLRAKTRRDNNYAYWDCYDSMSTQFSRGCWCEFCDIIVLYGRKPRTKAQPSCWQSWIIFTSWGRRGVFMVDDNFIGNKRNVKLLLRKLKVWQAEHKYPFRFNTEVY